MKWLAIGGGIFLAFILFVVGFFMVGPGGPNTYVGPMRVSAVAILALPMGYFFIARRTMTPVAGWIAGILMTIIAIGLWVPLLRSEWRWNVHSGSMTVWTAVWFVAALPFLRAGVKGIRKARL